MSGDFLQYIMDTTNNTINSLYSTYYSSINMSLNTYLNRGGIEEKNYDNKFKLDNNLIPAGFVLFIISLLIYFIDITSSN